MSFSSEVKKELCSISDKTKAIKKAELYGYLLFSRSFTKGNITFSTQSKVCADRFCDAVSGLYQCITQCVETKTNKKSGEILYTTSITLEEDRVKLLHTMGHSERDFNLRVNKAILDSNEYYSAFLRGAFLSCGSVSDPKGEYHLEFSVPYKLLASDLCNVIKHTSEILCEKVITPSVSIRRGSFVVYLKDKDAIAEVLAIMGASLASIEFVQAIIEKDIINKTNRKINSEIANLNKTAKASAKHLDAINKIMKNNKMDDLPRELYEIARLRWENPEMSLRELAENLSVPISRSGVNHRLDKLIMFADKISADNK